MEVKINRLETLKRSTFGYGQSGTRSAPNAMS